MTVATEQQVRMAAKLYAARDTVRSILGDRYPGEIVKIIAAVKLIAAVKQIEPIAAAIHMAKEQPDNPSYQLGLFASIVEMTEPSPGVVIP